MRRVGAVALIAVLGLTATGAERRLGASSLAAWRDGAWRTWWRSVAAPARWTAPDAELARALEWSPIATGVEWASLRLSCSAPAWRQKLIVVRIDPRRVRLSLEWTLSEDGKRPAWSIDRAPQGALVAFNAGQFVQSMPWGWLVTDGREQLRPGVGPLSRVVAIDRAGEVHWIAGDSLAIHSAAVGGGAESIVTAFQSYPTLLTGDGSVPEPLRAAGLGVNLAHRDARLALGEDRDGRLLVAMTRFDALGDVAGAIPIGLTTPETAALMGALGAHEAVMLDGGISAQLRLRESRSGRVHRWPGLRRVPLALVVLPHGDRAAER